MSQEVDLIVNMPPIASATVAPVLLLLLLTQARAFLPLNGTFSPLHNLTLPMTSLPITATYQKTTFHQTEPQVNPYCRPTIPTAMHTPQTPADMFKPTTIVPLLTPNPNQTKAFHSPYHPRYNDYTSQFPFPAGCFLSSLLLIPLLTLSLHGVDLFGLPRAELIHASFFTLFLTAMTRFITPLCKLALHCTKARVT
jgi:hypothetical protein